MGKRILLVVASGRSSRIGGFPKALCDIGGYNTEHYHPSEDVFFLTRLFNRGYRMVSTIAPFGYYRYAVNTSMKKETHIEWARDAIAYRCQARKLGWMYEKYSRYFEEAQLYFLCQGILKQFVRPCDYEGYFDEVPEAGKIRVKKMNFALYSIILRIHNYASYIRALF